MKDVADKHLTKISKATLKMSDAGALVMGGQTKEEARSHLKKMGHSEKEISKLEEGTEDMKMSLDAIKRHQEELKNPNLDSAAREMREKQIAMHKEKLKNVCSPVGDKSDAMTESSKFMVTLKHGTTGHKRMVVVHADDMDAAQKSAEKEHAGTDYAVKDVQRHELDEMTNEALKVGDDVFINAHTNKYHGKLGTISALNHAGNAHLVNIWHPTTGKRIASEHFPESSLVKESINENIEARYSDEDRAAMAKHVMTMNKAAQHLVGFEKANEHVHRNRYKKAKAAYDAIKNKYPMKEEQMPKNTLINDIKQKNENATPTIKNMLLAKVGQYVSNIKQSIAKESFLDENFWIKQAIADHSNQMQDKLANVGYEGSEEHQDDLKFMGSLQKDLKNAKLKKNESLDKMDES